MNEELDLSKNLQDLISEINNVELNFVELPLQEHPKLPQFNRTIRLLNIDAKSQQQLIVFLYEQVLRDKITGKEINIPLPTPDWVVYKDTWSYLRDSENQPIEAPLKDDSSKKALVKVPSYKYMIWLLKNDKAQFLQLIETYLTSFISIKIEELNRL